MHPILPSGDSKIFPVVGDPIGQVLSPGTMTALFARRGCNAFVVPMHVPAPDLPIVFRAAESVRNIGGLLVTVPHKVTAFALCGGATERARFVGSANVVRRSERGWFGDNTDGVGFVSGLELAGFPVRGRRVLLVGCGGAGAAVAFEMLHRGVAWLALHDSDIARRDTIIERLASRYPGRVGSGNADPSDYDLVANATPLGMSAADPLPVDATRLKSAQFVACVVTKPPLSPLIEVAQDIGCRTMSGAGMFEAQAETIADFLLGPKAESLHSSDRHLV